MASFMVSPHGMQQKNARPAILPAYNQKAKGEEVEGVVGDWLLAISFSLLAVNG
jgi:hypothetical protein